MNDVFISYSHQDAVFATKLASALAKDGLNIWIDVEDIPAGKNWRNEVDEGLRTADVMVLLISPASMASEEVQSEWNRFLREKKLVIPIILKQATTPSRLDVVQQLDFSDPAVSFEDHYARLWRVLSNKVVTPAPTSSASNPPPPVEPLAQKKDDSGNSRMVLIIVPLVVALIGAVATIASALISNQPAPSPTQVVIPTSAPATLVPATATTGNSGVATIDPSTPAATVVPQTSAGSGGFDVMLIYNDQASFIIRANGQTDLNGLELRSTKATVKLTESFPDQALSNFMIDSGDCLIFLKTGEAPPVPSGCETIFEARVLASDAFWYDGVGNRPRDLALYHNDTRVGICSATNQTCDFKG